MMLFPVSLYFKIMFYMIFSDTLLSENVNYITYSNEYVF